MRWTTLLLLLSSLACGIKAAPRPPLGPQEPPSADGGCCQAR